MRGGRAQGWLIARTIILASAVASLAGCASTSSWHQKHALAAGHGHSATKPARKSKEKYCIDGHGCFHVLASAKGYHATGLASWYGRGATGKPTASGESYNPHSMRVASKRLPFGTWVRITNELNQRQAVAMVNDRGPFHRGRIVDGSIAVAKRLGYYRRGVAPVSIKVVPRKDLSKAQKAVAKADERHAVHYAKHHHSVVAEAGKVTIHGVFDVTTFGLKLGVGVVGGVLGVTGDVAWHVLGFFF